MKIKLPMILLMSCFLSGCTIGGNHKMEGQTIPGNKAYFPLGDWRKSTPEEQGIDSEPLLKMLQTLRENNLPIHSFLLIRNGYLVLEAHNHPFNENTKNDLFSATKSFMSTLVGMAINEGKIKGVDQKVLEFFPEVKVPADELGISEMTIENLLTMSAGHKNDSVDAVFDSKNWPKDFFNQPFSTHPGSRFLYDSGASHLLSSVFKKATGETLDAYAKKHIFKYLGIKDYTWEKSGEGINTGGWGIRMKAADMAKFGYLILNKGNWDGRQIVPQPWIDTATNKHIESYWGENRGDDYGYQWWINPFGGFRADGFAGQYIYILSDSNLIAVVTSGYSNEPYHPHQLMREFVVPAVKSDDALKPNEKANTALNDLVSELKSPTPAKIPVLPDMAFKISGKALSLGNGNYTFTFKESGECVLELKQQGRRTSITVGLDGVYRVTDATRIGTLMWYPPYEKVALKGRWEGSDTFMLDWQYVGEPYNDEYKFVFKENEVQLEITAHVVGCAGPQLPYAKYTCSLPK